MTNIELEYQYKYRHWFYQIKLYLRTLFVKWMYNLIFKTEVDKDEYKVIESYLKTKGYSKNGNLYTKGFVAIEVHSKINTIYIYHDGISKNKTSITKNLTTGLVISENYFSRL